MLSSWVNEFKRFSPSMRVIRLHSGDREERELMRNELLADIKAFDVVVTTYEMAASQNMKTVLCHRIHWRYLVLDEGHRIKNEKTGLFERLRLIKAQRKLLLTGTPLQNNLHELWALLHFLHPELFADSAAFDKAFDLSRGQIDESVIRKCGELLSAFMVRRLKRDVLATLPRKTEALVYVPMSATQVELSRQLLLSGAQVLGRMQAQTEEGARHAEANRDWVQMQSLLISLRKCCNHPQLFGEWMGEVSQKLDEDLVTSSGKLAALDELLKLLLPQGKRVVLFSGWTSMLDIIEQAGPPPSPQRLNPRPSTPLPRPHRPAVPHARARKAHAPPPSPRSSSTTAASRTRGSTARPTACSGRSTSSSSTPRAPSSRSSCARRARAGWASRSPRPTRWCSTTRTSTRRPTCRRWIACTASGRPGR